MQRRAVNCDCRVSLAQLAKTRIVLAVARRRSHVNNTHAPRAHVLCPSTARRAAPWQIRVRRANQATAVIPTLQKKLLLQKIGQRIAYVLLTVDLNQG